jgi:2',3'-cyclic-nucleotide 2'-phosphodiesterase (5'-nucleotidase family)
VATTHAAQAKTFRIVHFSDFYQIQGVQGVGGLSKLATFVKEQRELGDPFIITFGGDLFFPSAMST